MENSNDFLKTKKFIEYLKDGQEVIIMPTWKSQSKLPYKATIKIEEVNWKGYGKCKELCTHVEGRHSAVINDYLFKRILIVKDKKYNISPLIKYTLLILFISTLIAFALYKIKQ